MYGHWQVVLDVHGDMVDASVDLAAREVAGAAERAIRGKGEDDFVEGEGDGEVIGCVSKSDVGDELDFTEMLSGSPHGLVCCDGGEGRLGATVDGVVGAHHPGLAGKLADVDPAQAVHGMEDGPRFGADVAQAVLLRGENVEEAGVDVHVCVHGEEVELAGKDVLAVD